MRAHTEEKHEMGKRFAIVIGVAAAGVMALGAQTALATGESVDSTPPDLQLSGPKKQSPQDDGLCDRQRCDLQVKASCGDRWCTARAKGRLTNVNKDKLSPAFPWDHAQYPAPGITPGQRSQTGPELSNDRQRKQVRQALAEGKTVKAKVTVKATDTSGNVATAKRTITLVKCGATSGPNCSAK